MTRIFLLLLCFAIMLLCCSTFSSTDETSGRAGTTGVACQNEDQHCAPGERCCNNAGGPPTCAKDCFAIDASFIITECARKSDCPSGFDCCASTNGGCGAGYYIGAKCLPAGGCGLCGDGGQQVLACDRFGAGDCPAGKTCSVTFNGTETYYACSY